MSEWRRLLVHLDGSPRSAVRLKLARQMASTDAGHVLAMLAVTPAWQTVPLSAFGDGGSAVLLQQAQAERRRMALDLVEHERGQVGAPLQWLESGDDPPVTRFLLQSLCCDLMVLGQHDPEDPLAWGSIPDFVPQVLAGSGKPGLVIPAYGEFTQIGRRILVAWKPTRETAAALNAALPLLKSAQEVIVMTWTETQPTGSVGPAESWRSLAAWLDAHGIRPQIESQGPAGDQVGELLLSAAADRQADLLVMGCYGHSRLREWVFGGVTKTILQSMTLPVLMAH